WAALGLKRVRVEPWLAPVLELVAHQPEVVDGLQVVAGRRFSVNRLGAGGEVGAEVGRGRPHRREPHGEVEPAGERYKARAAESSSSKSGTSAVSYRHAPRTVPLWSTRNAVRSATSSKLRNSCAIPTPRTASAFQSASSGKFRSSACIQATCD